MIELFDGTIAQNISRFQPGAKPETIIEAARLAGVEDMVTHLPQGYDTMVGARGAMLSAGQRQRVGLARALFGNPFLLVLDEPNSNLDSIGDAALNAAVVAAKHRGAIVIVIAHRPSAIAAVEKLLFLQNGVQAAFGPKDEVLRLITPPPAPPLSVVRGGER
jgi:ATP-binding cassette subfamily C protein PrsD